jgi:hypothetical protein
MALYVVMAAILVASGCALIALAKKSASRPEDLAQRTALDRWLDRVLARQLAFVVGQPLEAVEEAFSGCRPELQEQVEHALGSDGVMLTLGRVGSGRHVEVRLEAKLAGGRTLSSRFTTPWEQLPMPARLELLGRGDSAISRPWSPPWR